MKKEKMEITKNILIEDLVEKYPKLAEVLVEEYGFHCIGCMASGMETLEQGAQVHGMSQKEIKKMVEDLKRLAVKDEK
jgi:hybrid cluster-associated redox disulfide protein